MSFKIVVSDDKTKARAGILGTKSGCAETPFFMPVATKTTVKHISPEDLELMGTQAIICNAFILSLRPGVKVISGGEGIGKFMTFSGVVFTDSGGFQMYSPKMYLESKENGVVFRNPFSGEKCFITPEKDMEIQLGLGGDVAMCLDTMPLIEHSKEAIAEAVRKTTNWAKICREHHTLLQKDKKDGEKQLLFGIIQGGIHEDLREKSAKEIFSVSFDGYALGGLALGEEKKDEYRMIEVVKKIVPEDKPLYLMGAGNPLELLEAISRGCDIFDSRFPTQNARRGTLFTNQGRLLIRKAIYSEDFSPIDESCDCFVCKRYSRAYIRHLLRQGEGVGYRLASFHNLYFLQNLMKRAREAIKSGTFINLLNDFRGKYEKREEVSSKGEN